MIPYITKVQCFVCEALVDAKWSGEVGEGDLIDILVSGAPHDCKKPSALSGTWAGGFSCWVRTGQHCIDAGGVVLLEHEPAGKPEKQHEDDFRDRFAGTVCGRCGRVAEDHNANYPEADIPWMATRWRLRR